VSADVVNDIESPHISEVDVGDGQAKLAPARLVDSVAPSQSYRHAIAAILENYPECIGHTPFILDDEDSAFLLLAFTHKRPLAICMPAGENLLTRINAESDPDSSALVCGR
jgi:hypothetical protein